MKLKEKIIRKVNASVQNSSASEETKLFTENMVLAIDIFKRLAELTSDKETGYAQRKQLNENLRHILGEVMV